MGGVLYVVGTPIGNLEDITLRALRILKEVDLIAAEDTRHTGILLSHYGLKRPLIPYHEHNEKSQSVRLIGMLKEGKSVALLSDAGTPTISDPGYRLVSAAVKEAVRVVPIPGPSALTAILSAGGLPSDRFVFEGFLPNKKKQRRERLRELSRETRTLIFFEAPHRLGETLQDLADIFGEREVTLGREVTKAFEEFFHGRLREVAERVARERLRGEVTLLVRGIEEQASRSREEVEGEIEKLRRQGMRVKEIAEILGERFSIPKRDIYRLALKFQQG